MHLKFHSKVKLHTPPPAIGEPVLRRSSLLPFLSVSSVLILDHYLNFKCLDSHHQEYHQNQLILYLNTFSPICLPSMKKKSFTHPHHFVSPG